MKSKKMSTAKPAQRGVAALSLAAVLVAVTAMLLALQKGQTEGSETSRIEDQLETGEWARDALDAFAFAHARLPCPATSPNGAEACTNAAKGWLPVSTLEDYGATLPQAARRQSVSYMVYKGSGGSGDPDLTQKSDHFQPLIYSQTPVSGHPEITALTDFCQKLLEIPPTPTAARAKAGNAFASNGRADRPAVNYVGLGRPINVAYAVATTQSGKPFLATASNADMSRLTLEAPDRLQSQEYSEQVAAVPGPDLFGRLGCASVMVSLDALASANNFTAISVGAREGNISTSDLNVKMGSLFVSADVIAVTDSVIDLLQSPALGGENAVLKAIAELGLPFTLPTVLNHAKGILDALAGMAAGYIPLAKNTLSLANNSWQLINMLVLQSVIQDSKVWDDPSPLLKTSDNADNEIVPDVIP